MDFEQFQLTYLPSADGSGTIDISICDYPNITQPTRAQLIALVPQAKQRLARLAGSATVGVRKIRSGKTCRLLCMCSRVAFTPRRRHGPRSPCKKKAKQHRHPLRLSPMDSAGSQFQVLPSVEPRTSCGLYISNPARGCGLDRENPDRGAQRRGLDAARSSPNPRAWIAVPTCPCSLQC